VSSFLKDVGVFGPPPSFSPLSPPLPSLDDRAESTVLFLLPFLLVIKVRSRTKFPPFFYEKRGGRSLCRELTFSFLFLFFDETAGLSLFLILIVSASTPPLFFSFGGKDVLVIFLA